MPPRERITPAPGQESAWDYPRPAICEPSTRHVRIDFGGVTIAETNAAYRVLETSHPPSWYLPPGAFAEGVLEPVARRSFCEWKGTARYFDVVAGGKRASAAAWCYPEPSPPFAGMAGYVSVYPALMDACFIDGERVMPQAGRFYGGLITPDVVGPFKGEPGTEFW